MKLLLLIISILQLGYCQQQNMFSVSEVNVTNNYTSEEYKIVKQYFLENLIPSDNGLYHFEFSVFSFPAKVIMEFNCSNCLWHSLSLDKTPYSLESMQFFKKEFEFKPNMTKSSFLVAWKISNKTNPVSNFLLSFRNETSSAVFYKKSFTKV